jgi:hypothetical protein
VKSHFSQKTREMGHPGLGLSGLWDMGTVKAIVGFLVIIGCVYAGFQIAPPLLSNYSFQDDLRSVAMMGGSNVHTTDQELVESVIRKARDHQITLAPENVTVQRIGTPGAPAVYVAAEYNVPVTLPGYSFTLHFNPSSGNKGF